MTKDQVVEALTNGEFRNMAELYSEIKYRAMTVAMKKIDVEVLRTQKKHKDARAIGEEIKWSANKLKKLSQFAVIAEQCNN